MKNFITQKDFFENIDSGKYGHFKNNLCGLVSVFLVLKELGSEVLEQEIFDRAIKIKAYEVPSGWKYEKLILIFRHFCIHENISFKDINIFKSKLFHNRKLKKIFFNLQNQIFIASIKLDENHLIIIDRVEYNNIYYTSVGTMQYEPKKNHIIKMDDFLKVYNKRGILINL